MANEIMNTTTFGNSISTLANLPQNVMAGFNQLANEAFNGVSNSGLRFIRMAGTQFNLVEGQETTTVDKLVCVLLGAASCNHALWYKHSFSQGAQGTAPDLVWHRPNDDTFPDALPVELRQKINVQGQLKWGFQIKRRTVWAVIRPGLDGQMFVDIDTPYILDLPSMSLYGPSRVELNEYKWGSLGTLCRKLSVQGITVYPSMFPIQIAADPTIRGNNGVMIFKPMRDANNNIAFLDQDTIMRVFNASMSQEIKDLCNVREKLTLDDAQSPTPQASTPPAAPKPAAPAAAQPQAAAPVQPQPASQPQAPNQPAAPQQGVGVDTASLLSQAQSFLAGVAGQSLQQPAQAQPAASQAPTAQQEQPQQAAADLQSSNIEDMLASLR